MTLRKTLPVAPIHGVVHTPRCWTCEGSGIQPSVLYLIPFWPQMKCRRCKGTGVFGMTQGHTPGPWKVSQGSPGWIGYGVIATSDDSRKKVCSIAHDDLLDIDKPSPIAEADARLIAAAPAMLEEVTNAIDVLDPDMGRHEIVELRERLIRFQSSIQVV